LWLYSRGKGNRDLGYQLDNRGFQVIFQNSSGAKPASHSVETVAIFPDFKAVRLGSKKLHTVVRFRMSVTVALLLGTASGD
jgi:hypothetical protein